MKHAFLYKKYACSHKLLHFKYYCKLCNVILNPSQTSKAIAQMLSFVWNSLVYRGMYNIYTDNRREKMLHLV